MGTKPEDSSAEKSAKGREISLAVRLRECKLSKLSHMTDKLSLKLCFKKGKNWCFTRLDNKLIFHYNASMDFTSFIESWNSKMCSFNSSITMYFTSWLLLPRFTRVFTNEQTNCVSFSMASANSIFSRSRLNTTPPAPAMRLLALSPTAGPSLSMPSNPMLSTNYLLLSSSPAVPVLNLLLIARIAYIAYQTWGGKWCDPLALSFLKVCWTLF